MTAESLSGSLQHRLFVFPATHSTMRPLCHSNEVGEVLCLSRLQPRWNGIATE
jgi:hypothetical protein